MTDSNWTLVTQSPDETLRLGEKLGRLLHSGDCICLSGNLGAGKTCLVRGIARGWGALERPSSPTFTLINEYHRADSKPLFHVDCYRMSSIGDAVSSGLEDALDQDGPIVIEWAERVQSMLPEDALWIAIKDQGETRRSITARAAGKRAAVLLAGLSGSGEK